MRLLVIFVLVGCSGCFWHRWTRKADYAREAAVVPLNCPEEQIAVANLPEGFKATGCGHEAWCDNRSGDWKCTPVLAQ